MMLALAPTVLQVRAPLRVSIRTRVMALVPLPASRMRTLKSDRWKVLTAG
jgi:hypothetical protein